MSFVAAHTVDGRGVVVRKFDTSVSNAGVVLAEVSVGAQAMTDPEFLISFGSKIRPFTNVNCHFDIGKHASYFVATFTDFSPQEGFSIRGTIPMELEHSTEFKIACMVTSNLIAPIYEGYSNITGTFSLVTKETTPIVTSFPVEISPIVLSTDTWLAYSPLTGFRFVANSLYLIHPGGLFESSSISFDLSDENIAWSPAKLLEDCRVRTLISSNGGAEYFRETMGGAKRHEKGFEIDLYFDFTFQRVKSIDITCDFKHSLMSTKIESFPTIILVEFFIPSFAFDRHRMTYAKSFLNFNMTRSSASSLGMGISTSLFISFLCFALLFTL